MLTSPTIALLKRELVAALRSWRLYLMMVLAVLAALLGLWPAAAAPDQAETAVVALTLVAIALHAAGLLFLPALAGGAICTEKQQDTWPLLVTSLLRPAQILRAKYIAILGVFVLVVIAAMPVVGILFFFLGVSASQFVISFGIVLLSAAMTTALGLASSAYIQQPLRAIMCSYLLALLFNGGLAVLYAFMTFAGFAPVHPISVGVSLCPAFALYWQVVAGAATAGTLAALAFSPANCVLYMLAVGLAAWLAAARGVARRREARASAAHKTIDDARLLAARRKKFPYYLIDPQRRKEPIDDNLNPMLAKERMAGFGRRGTMNVRALYLSFLFWSLYMYLPLQQMLDNDYAEAVGAYVLAQGLMLAAVAPALTASLMTREQQLGNVDMLRMTLMAPREIFSGKVFAVLASLAWPAAGMLLPGLGLLISAPVSLASPMPALQAYAASVLTVALVLAISLYMSAGARSGAVAMMRSYTLCLVCLVVLQWVVIMGPEAVESLQPDFITHDQKDMLHNIAVSLYPSPAMNYIFTTGTPEPGEQVLMRLVNCFPSALAVFLFGFAAMLRFIRHETELR